MAKPPFKRFSNLGDPAAQGPIPDRPPGWQDELAKRLNSGDPFQIVVGGELFIESRLNGIIGALLPKLTAGQVLSISFPARIRISVGSGLIREIEGKALHCLYTLRNKFAHDLAVKIKEADARELRNLILDIGYDHRFEDFKSEKGILDSVGHSIALLDTLMYDREMTAKVSFAKLADFHREIEAMTKVIPGMFSTRRTGVPLDEDNPNEEVQGLS